MVQEQFDTRWDGGDNDDDEEEGGGGGCGGRGRGDLDLSLIHNTSINSKLIIDLNLKHRTIKSLQKIIQKKIF
jgi:hypothetical protein